ncbi:hypothetical protein ACK3TF_001466 [Chlorella vulgaris]
MQRLQVCVLALVLAAQLAPGCAAASSATSKRRLLQAPASAAAAAPALEPTNNAASWCCQQLAAIGFSSNLPVVVLDTMGAPLEVKGVDALSRLCTCSPGLPAPDYDGLSEAAVRGSTSATAHKKSFKLQLRQAAGFNDTKKQDWALLGMPADADWVLYGGDEVDLTLGMRNYLGYNLARASGQYAARTVWCELFLMDDGAAELDPSHYHGIYIAMEHPKIAQQRVDVAKLDPPNLSGGYLFTYDNDNTEAGDVLFGPLSGWDHPFQMNRSPSYTSFIDSPSWLDYFLITELTKNPDGYRGSVYLHKDRDLPMAAGPIWDLNEAFGQCCGYPIDGWQQQGVSGPGVAGGSAISTDGWRFLICADADRCKIDPTDGLSRWYRRMWEDDRFKSGASTRWAQLRAGPWSDTAVEAIISSVSAQARDGGRGRLSSGGGGQRSEAQLSWIVTIPLRQIKPAVLRSYDRWASVILKPWFPNSEVQWTTEVSNLKDWTLQHMAWMDGAFAQAGASGPPAAGRRCGNPRPAFAASEHAAVSNAISSAASRGPCLRPRATRRLAAEAGFSSRRAFSAIGEAGRASPAEASQGQQPDAAVDGQPQRRGRGRPPGHPAWNKGLPHSETHRKRISIKLKQKWKDPDFKRSVSEAMLGKPAWNLGQPHDPETLRKMSEAKLGSRLPLATRKLISKANMGRVVSEETRAKVGDRHRGLPKTPEHRAKLASIARRRHAATRVLHAVEAVYSAASTRNSPAAAAAAAGTGGAGGTPGRGRPPGSATGMSGGGAAAVSPHSRHVRAAAYSMGLTGLSDGSGKRLSRTQILNTFKSELREYRTLQEELSTWTAAFREKNNRKPNLMDVQRTGIPWLIEKFKQYVVLRDRLFSDTSVLRGKLQDAIPDPEAVRRANSANASSSAPPSVGGIGGMGPTNANGPNAVSRTAVASRFSAVMDYKMKRQAALDAAAAAAAVRAAQPGEARAEDEGADPAAAARLMSSQAPPRVRMAMQAALDYRQGKANETKAAADAAAAAARSPLGGSRGGGAAGTAAGAAAGAGSGTILRGTAFTSKRRFAGPDAALVQQPVPAPVRSAALPARVPPAPLAASSDAGCSSDSSAQPASSVPAVEPCLPLQAV